MAAHSYKQNEVGKSIRGGTMLTNSMMGAEQLVQPKFVPKVLDPQFDLFFSTVLRI